MFLRLFCGQRMFSKLCFCCNSCLLLFLVCFGLTIWHWHGLGYQKEACQLTQQCLKHCPKSCKAICKTSRNCRSISLQRSRGFLHFSRCFFTTWLLDNNSEWHNLALPPLNCRVALCLYAATEYAGKVRNHSPPQPPQPPPVHKIGRPQWFPHPIPWMDFWSGVDYQNYGLT